jgi:hypothetical protein
VQNNAVTTPRVLNSTTNRLRSILEETEIFPNGTEIMKNSTETRFIEDQLHRIMKEQTYTGLIMWMEIMKK